MKQNIRQFVFALKFPASGCKVWLALLAISIFCVSVHAQPPTPTPAPKPVVKAPPTPAPKPPPTPSPTPALAPTPTPNATSSDQFISRIWNAMDANPPQLEGALTLADTVISKWSDDANRQQAERLQSGQCQTRPRPANAEERKEYNHKYWALNDVAASLIIRGRVLVEQGKFEEARAAFNRVKNNYNCAYYWDPKAKSGEGLFISAANAAGNRLDDPRLRTR